MTIDNTEDFFLFINIRMNKACRVLCRLCFACCLVGAVFFLASCGVDTTGISADSSRQPLGSPSAAVTVVEYGDLQCPACKSAHSLLTKPLIEKYGSRIRFEFRHFPLYTIHPYAMEAAQASECAADQGKFWEFLDLAYEHQENLKSTELRVWAAELLLEADLFDRCVRSGIKKGAVQTDIAAGEELKVNSTPTYFVNGQRLIIKDLTNLDEAVAAALQQASSIPL